MVRRIAERTIEFWALAGGALLVAVVAINVASVLGAAFGATFPGDFELTEVGVAIAAFAFLPWCQLSRGNVSADIFTSRWPQRRISALRFLSDSVAGLVSVLLFWRMYLGMLDQMQYGYTTTILQFPHWIAFVPILISLGLLSVAAILTATQDIAELRSGARNA